MRLGIVALLRLLILGAAALIAYAAVACETDPGPAATIEDRSVHLSPVP